MGWKHKGEIAQRTGLTRPDIGVYTNIAPVHIEFFGTIEKIAEAKQELLENVKSDGKIIINADNEHVMRISEKFAGEKITYGIDHPAAYRATAITERGLLGTRFTIRAENADRDFELALPGRHNLANLIAAIAAARAIGISWDGIAKGVQQVKPANHRGVVVPYGGATLYDDSYNSNPYALASALTLLRQAEVTGRRIAVIGDMLELGERELEYHTNSGREIPKEVDVVIGVGKRAKSLLDGAREAGFSNDRLHYFDDAPSAGDFLEGFIKDGDLVLIKASRGIGLDRIVTMLTGAGGTH